MVEHEKKKDSALSIFLWILGYWSIAGFIFYLIIFKFEANPQWKKDLERDLYGDRVVEVKANVNFDNEYIDIKS